MNYNKGCHPQQIVQREECKYVTKTSAAKDNSEEHDCIASAFCHEECEIDSQNIFKPVCHIYLLATVIGVIGVLTGVVLLNKP